MTTALRVDGVDLSHWQNGPIDWPEAKKAGVRWLYQKATEGATFTDGMYKKRRAEAKANGLPFGAYHFAKPSTTSATVQAKFFLKVSAIKPGDLMPMLDLETREGLTDAQLARWAHEWWTVVRAALKMKTGGLTYTHFSVGENLATKLWGSRYSDVNAAPVIPFDWKFFEVRQFSNGFYGVPRRTKGFEHASSSGAIDLNTNPAGAEKFIAANTFGTVPDPAKAPVKVSPIKSPPKAVTGTGTFGTLNLLCYQKKGESVAEREARWKSDIDKMWKYAGVLAMQECRYAGPFLDAYAAKNKLFVSGKGTKHDNRTLVNPKVWKIDDTAYYEAFKGASGVFPDGFNDVTLITSKRTGKRLYIDNIHLPVHANRGENFRINAYFDGIARIKQDEHNAGIQGRGMILLGDTNEDIDQMTEPWDPRVTLKNFRFDTPRTSGTLDTGRAQYDLIATNDKSLVCKKADIVKGLGSDHNGVLAQETWKNH